MIATCACSAAAAAAVVSMLVIAGIRSAGGSKNTAGEPLQTKPAASENVQATQNRFPSKAAVPSTFTTTDRASAVPSAGSGQADQPATATTGSQLFANAGHEVVSVVADDDKDDDVSDDADGTADRLSAGQQTLSTTPYDELD